MKLYSIHDGTFDRMVLANNQAEASLALRCSVYSLRKFGNTIPATHRWFEVAMSEPIGRVWKRDLREPSAGCWVFDDVNWKPKEKVKL